MITDIILVDTQKKYTFTTNKSKIKDLLNDKISFYI